MKKILVTGAEGFIGRNICVALEREELEVISFCRGDQNEVLAERIAEADAVIHLAGVNRPQNEGEFWEGNNDLAKVLVDLLEEDGRKLPLIVSSTIQAERDNVYGKSKLAGEQHYLAYSGKTFVYRLPNVFGKWSRPEYNTVVATFCHNVSRKLPVQVNDPAALICFVYVDDVVREFLNALKGETTQTGLICNTLPEYEITLGDLHEKIVSFRESRESNLLPNLGDPLEKYLYTTYLSFLPEDDFARDVDLKTDDRGWLFEFVKSQSAGQIFISKTRPGVTRGNHYHDTKVEKFCVIQGQGMIRFRSVRGKEIFEYPVNGDAICVVDIPPGYTHSIENTGEAEMITLFWANEIFDPEHPDTHFVEV